jgi:hypothetical protein
MHSMHNKPVGAASRGDYAQEVLYIAKEHMDVRRDCVSFAPHPKASPRDAAPTGTGVSDEFI